MYWALNWEADYVALYWTRSRWSHSLLVVSFKHPGQLLFNSINPKCCLVYQTLFLPFKKWSWSCLSFSFHQVCLLVLVRDRERESCFSEQVPNLGATCNFCIFIEEIVCKFCIWISCAVIASLSVGGEVMSLEWCCSTCARTGARHPWDSSVILLAPLLSSSRFSVPYRLVSH